MTIYAPLLAKLTPRAKRLLFKGNYERIFDQARKAGQSMGKSECSQVGQNPLSPNDLRRQLMSSNHLGSKKNSTRLPRASKYVRLLGHFSPGIGAVVSFTSARRFSAQNSCPGKGMSKPVV